MPYLDDEIKSTLLNLVIGILVGYISFSLNRPVASFFVGVVAYIAASVATKKVFNLKKEKKWWLSGIFVFSLSWIISWTVLYNL